MSKSAEKFGGFPHFVWLFSRVLALWRTLVRRRKPNHAFCILMKQPLLLPSIELGKLKSLVVFKGKVYRPRAGEDKEAVASYVHNATSIA